MKKFQPDKLKPKSEKCVFIGYPKENVGYTFYHRSEGKIFVAKNGSFLEKEFLSKEVSGRKLELDEVTVPAPLLESSSSQKPVPVTLSVGDDTYGITIIPTTVAGAQGCEKSRNNSQHKDRLPRFGPRGCVIS